MITLDAPYCAGASDTAFCALLEHELYHCGQKVNDGTPVFSRETGLPQWAIRGHDVEEFIGVVRRYGKDAAGWQVAEMVRAAAQYEREPVFSPETLAGVCGSCT